MSTVTNLAQSQWLLFWWWWWHASSVALH